MGAKQANFERLNLKFFESYPLYIATLYLKDPTKKKI